MSLETWQEQLRRGGLELAVLLCLAGRARYGLEVIRHLQEGTDLVVTEGTLYPLMARLTGEGLLTSEWREDQGPHPRKYYTLSARGHQRLEQMSGHWREFTGKIDRLLEEAKR
jgi:PadR family transcriptional regulator PadR